MRAEHAARSPSMKWKHELATGSEHCNFQSLKRGISKRVLREIGHETLAEIHSSLDSAVRLNNGINKVQRFVNDINGQVLLVIQWLTETEVKKFARESDFTERQLMGYNEQFILFEDEFNEYAQIIPWLESMRSECFDQYAY